MRVTSSRAYSRPPPVPRMPQGLVELMDGLSREVLKNNPSDVYQFCANHMKKLLEIRDGPPRTKSLTIEQKIAIAQEKVRQRAKERQEKFDKEFMLQSSKSNIENGTDKQIPEETNNVDLPIKVPIVPSLKEPVHHDLDLEHASEIEISQTDKTSPVTDSPKPVELIQQEECVTVIPKNIIPVEVSHDIEEVKYINLPNDMVVPECNTVKEDVSDVPDDMGLKEDDNNKDASILEKVLGEVPDVVIMNEHERFVEDPTESHLQTIKETPNENLIEPEVLPELTLVDEVFNSETVDAQEVQLNKTDEIGENHATGNLDAPEHIDIQHQMEDNDDKVVSHKDDVKCPIDDSNNQDIHATENFDSKMSDMVKNEKNLDEDKSDSQMKGEFDKNLKTVSEEPIMESTNNEMNADKPSEVVNIQITLQDESDDVAHIYIDESDNAVSLLKNTSGNNENMSNDNINKDQGQNKTGEKPLENYETCNISINNKPSEPEKESTDSLRPPESTPSAELKDVAELAESTVEDSTALSNINVKDLETDAPEINLNKDGANVPRDEKVNPTDEQETAESALLSSTSDSIGNNTIEDNLSTIESESLKTDDDSTLNNSNSMDLETAAITIQKVFRSFMFKSRNSTFEDSAHDGHNSLDADEDSEKKEEYYAAATINKDRRALGITRMDTVLQTVNEEKSLSLSTDDSSTLSSAATTIQAHVRGFLVRSRMNSNKTISLNSLVNSHEVLETDSEQQKSKTVLNIHIVPEEGNYLSRDESLITSMDLSLDGSPPSSINLHPLSCDISERRKMLKREDAIQSISPPSNNSGKLSEESVKEVSINEGDIIEVEPINCKTKSEEDQTNDLENDSSEMISDSSATPITEIHVYKSEEPIVSPKEPMEIPQEREVSLTIINSDEADVITPYVPSPRPCSESSSKLVHSGEFHDVVLPTKVSRNDTSVVRGE